MASIQRAHGIFSIRGTNKCDHTCLERLHYKSSTEFSSAASWLKLYHVNSGARLRRDRKREKRRGEVAKVIKTKLREELELEKRSQPGNNSTVVTTVSAWNVGDEEVEVAESYTADVWWLLSPTNIVDATERSYAAPGGSRELEQGLPGEWAFGFKCEGSLGVSHLSQIEGLQAEEGERRGKDKITFPSLGRGVLQSPKSPAHSRGGMQL
ncbi:hypothetical protein BT69DRAFT_1303523 [Atractiella rhizophila]|nr:hypothetical protein BT69DRAFT_1303523 [Atractiella rhizophila]